MDRERLLTSQGLVRSPDERSSSMLAAKTAALGWELVRVPDAEHACFFARKDWGYAKTYEFAERPEQLLRAIARRRKPPGEPVSRDRKRTNYVDRAGRRVGAVADTQS